MIKFAFLIQLLGASSISYMKVVPLALELGGGVDFVGHDSCDGLLHILYPLNHLGLSHDVDILDERIVLLPVRHLECVLHFNS